MTVKELRLYACDKFDREEQKKDYYIWRSDKKDGQFYTNNPIKEIHLICPKTIVVDTYNFKAEMLALYINCLTNEDYILDSKRALVKEEDGNSIWGHSVYFKRKPEEECKIRTDK